MTTTPTSASNQRVVGSVLRKALLGAAIAWGTVTIIAVGVGGQAALFGALVGGAIGIAFFAFGVFALNMIAGLMPQLALLVALGTYAFQTVLLFAVFQVLRSSGLLGSTLSPIWLSAALLTVVAAWILVQVRVHTQARIVAFEGTSDQGVATAPRVGSKAGA